MPSLSLTDAVIKRIKTPAPRVAKEGAHAGKPMVTQVDYWDALFANEGALALRVSSTGKRSWIIQPRVLIAGKWTTARVTLGGYPEISLAEARQKAREAIVAAKRGEDPRELPKLERQAQEHESRQTFGVLASEFLEKYVDRKLRGSTGRNYRHALKGPDVAAWQDRPISKIAKRDVLDVLDTLVKRGSPVQANRTLAYLKRFFGWCAERDVIEIVPTDRVKAPAKNPKRERALSAAELVEVWIAVHALPGELREPSEFTPLDSAHGGILGALVKVLILTGQRLNEVAGMRWSELRDIDGESPSWELPGERTKNGLPHVVPLAPQAVVILNDVRGEAKRRGKPFSDSPFVFSSKRRTPVSTFSDLKRWLRGLIAAARTKTGLEPMPHWQLHDLRRTASTRMHDDLKERPEIVEAILNHISGVRSGVAGTYNRALYSEDKRRALAAWADYVDRLVAGEAKGNVVPLFGAR